LVLVPQFFTGVKVKSGAVAPTAMRAEASAAQKSAEAAARDAKNFFIGQSPR